MATKTTKKVAAEATEVKEVKVAEAVETADTTAKKAAPKKAAAVKTTAAPKKETPVKEEAPAKKTTTKKTVAEKTEETYTEPEVSVIFECGGKQILAKEVLAKAMDAFRGAHADVEIKEMKLYVNAEDSCAYIVVNGEEYPEDKIDIM